MQADSPYIIPLPKGTRCETIVPDWPCRFCQKFHDGRWVSPVVCYRYWHRYFSVYREIQHLPGNWLLVQPFLEARGYKLQLRNEQDGKSSATEIYDHQLLYGTETIQSAHTYPAFNRHGQEVFIKVVPTEATLHQELLIWTMLTGETLGSDPRNHTVPIKEILYFYPDFRSEGIASKPSDRRAFMVMDRFELLHCGDFIRPAIQTFEDFVDLCLQLIEAILFLHELGVVHRDLTENNVVYRKVEGKPRYFLLDYQYSAYFPRPWKSPPLISPEWGMSEPEAAKSSEPYNPFLADIWSLGNLLRGIYDTQVKHQIASCKDISDLFRHMMRDDPMDRPTLSEALICIQLLNKGSIANHGAITGSDDRHNL